MIYESIAGHGFTQPCATCYFLRIAAFLAAKCGLFASTEIFLHNKSYFIDVLAVMVTFTDVMLSLQMSNPQQNFVYLVQFTDKVEYLKRRYKIGDVIYITW